MSRPLRIEFENAFYHVMNRGRGRQTVFHNSDFYHGFLLCLEEAHKRFGLEVHSYCLMSNHYHLLIKTPRANLSRIMRHIDGIYTQRHNRLRRTDGSLFRGRYKAIVVEAGAYLLQVSRYIHRNPIETRKPLVVNLEDYPWSSYAAFVNRTKPPVWLNRDAVFGELSSHHRYRAYRQYVDQGNDSNISQFYQLEHRPSVLGDEDFRQQMKAKLKNLDREVDTRSLQHPMDLDLIIQAVAKYYALDREDIVNTRRGKGVINLPRWLAMKLCQELGSAKLVDIAERFNVGHYSTVSQTIGRLNRLMESNSEVSQIYNILSQDLMGWTRSI